MSEAVACPSCGAKLRLGHDRCPRCRVWLIERDPEAQVARSKQFSRLIAGLVATFLIIVSGLWLVSEPAPSAETHTMTSDPLAGRRKAAKAAPSTVATPAEPPGTPRPFMEPTGVAATAYASGNYQSAVEQYQAAIQKNPDDAEALSNLGQVLVRMGKPQEALPHFERALTLLPNRWAYRFNYARALGLANRWDEAIASYRQAQSLFADDYATTFNLALALHKKGDDAGAIPEYEKAIALAPQDASFRFALALSYEKLRRNAEAAGAYEEYLRLAPQAGDAERVRERIAVLTGATPAAATPGQPAGGQTGTVR
jgi:cytochrome c-type biogenesis protein CcmH/NrfG